MSIEFNRKFEIINCFAIIAFDYVIGRKKSRFFSASFGISFSVLCPSVIVWFIGFDGVINGYNKVTVWLADWSWTRWMDRQMMLSCRWLPHSLTHTQAYKIIITFQSRRWDHFFFAVGFLNSNLMGKTNRFTMADVRKYHMSVNGHEHSTQRPSNTHIIKIYLTAQLICDHLIDFQIRIQFSRVFSFDLEYWM